MIVENFVELFDELVKVYPELQQYHDKCFSIPANYEGYGITDEALQDCLLSQIEQNKKVIFHGNKETFETPIFNKIHDVLDSLPTVDNTFFFTLGCKDYEEAYNKFQAKRNVKNKLILISYNYWEYWASTTYKNIQFIHDNVYETKIKQKKFFCLNRIERLHRIYLYAHAVKYEWMNDSYFSFVTPTTDYISYFIRMGNEVLKHQDIYPEVENILFVEKWVVEVVERTKENLPLLLPVDKFNNAYIDVNLENIQLFNDSYLSIVTETLFGDCQVSPFSQYEYIGGYKFLTEKTFKPIAAKHPFILVSCKDNLKYLRSLGYKTFHPYINETYDDIEDDELRMKYITDEVLRLNSLTNDEWLRLQENVKDVVEHNYNTLVGKTDFRITTIDKSWFE